MLALFLTQMQEIATDKVDMPDVEWVMADRSPGLKAISVELLAGSDNQSMDIPTRGTAL